MRAFVILYAAAIAIGFAAMARAEVPESGVPPEPAGDSEFSNLWTSNPFSRPLREAPPAAEESSDFVLLGIAHIEGKPLVSVLERSRRSTLMLGQIDATSGGDGVLTITQDTDPKKVAAVIKVSGKEHKIGFDLNSAQVSVDANGNPVDGRPANPINPRSNPGVPPPPNYNPSIPAPRTSGGIQTPGVPMPDQVVQRRRRIIVPAAQPLPAGNANSSNAPATP